MFVRLLDFLKQPRIGSIGSGESVGSVKSIKKYFILVLLTPHPAGSRAERVYTPLTPQNPNLLFPDQPIASVLV